MLIFIENTPRAYAWGSRDALPEMLGTSPTGEPQAELWLGAHPGSPATVAKATPAKQTLIDLIKSDPDRYGVDGGPLPFLLKVLAIGAPLSLQVHPDPEQAAAGYAAEEAAGVARDAAERNYGDPRHKPELLVALSDVTALSGFRSLQDARRELFALAAAARTAGDPDGSEALARVAARLEGEDHARIRHEFLGWAFGEDAAIPSALAALRAILTPAPAPAPSTPTPPAPASTPPASTPDPPAPEAPSHDFCRNSGENTQRRDDAGKNRLEVGVAPGRSPGRPEVGAPSGDGPDGSDGADGIDGPDGIDPERLAALRSLLETHPRDPGVLVSLLLHLVRLAPGEAVYLRARQIHAYLSGIAVEVMASSDNVLRAGLTSKHVDIDELRRIVDTEELPDPRFPCASIAPGLVVWRPDVPDFQLYRATLCDEDEEDPWGPRIAASAVDLPAPHPLVLVVTAGRVRVERDGAEVAEVVSARRGQSLYVSAGEPVQLTGHGEVYLATVGNPEGAEGTARATR